MQVFDMCMNSPVRVCVPLEALIAKAATAGKFALHWVVMPFYPSTPLTHEPSILSPEKGDITLPFR
jgi:hypothetical protein